jgi:hypothetical protein
MTAVVLQIDKAEVRFGDAPATGVALDPSTLTDFSCQVTKAEITSQSNTTTTSVPATFCQPASELSVPVASTFQLGLDFLQDWTQAAGLSAFLFKHDAERKAFALYLEGNVNPVATGEIIVQAGGFGGTPGQPLTSSVTLNINGYPDIKDATGASIRAIPATGATAGTPGSFTPAGAAAPASVAALTASTIVASPTTAWTTGQYVQTATAGDPGKAHWNGTAWAAGAAS